MLIVLDFDETYTEDPMLWNALVTAAKARLHDVVICTMRFPNDAANKDVIKVSESLGIPIVYAGLCADKFDAMSQAGYNPENAIWIDDSPQYICMMRCS